MKLKVWNIEWDISDEDVEDAFGSLTDDNGLPYTTKDFGIPTIDEVVEIEVDDNDWDEVAGTPDEDEVVADALSDIYGWLVRDGFKWEPVTTDN